MSDPECVSYAGDDERGTVTITAVTKDDSGLSQCDTEEMEIEMPACGVLQIEIEGEQVSLEPNSVDGNPRVDR